MVSYLEPPPLLYHFTDAGGLLGILNNHVLWATHISFLNDSREVVHAVEIAKEEIRQLQSRPQAPQVLLENLMFGLNAMVGFTYVVSFSEHGDLLSQWRGYSPNGGYCLGFHSSALKQLAQRGGFSFVKCIYSRADQEDAVLKFLSRAIELFPHWSPPADVTFDGGLSRKANLFSSLWFYSRMQNIATAVKDPAFEEEREWRLVADVDYPNIKMRTRGSLLVPYMEIALKGDGPSSYYISKVTIGPTSSPELSEIGLIRLITLPDNVGIVHGRSSIPYRT